MTGDSFTLTALAIPAEIDTPELDGVISSAFSFGDNWQNAPSLAYVPPLNRLFVVNAVPCFLLLLLLLVVVVVLVVSVSLSLKFRVLLTLQNESFQQQTVVWCGVQMFGMWQVQFGGQRHC